MNINDAVTRIITKLKALETRFTKLENKSQRAANDLIDFPVSSTYRDAYYEQGMTPTPSLSRQQPEPTSSHAEGCMCETCWETQKTELNYTEERITKSISDLWVRVRQIQRDSKALSKSTTKTNIRGVTIE